MPQALEKGSNIPPALAAPLRSKMGRGLLRAKLGKRFVPTISKPVRLKPINLQITLRRQEELYDHRVISVQDLINAQDTNRTNQANLDAAKSKVVSAEAQLLAGQAQVRTFQALAQSLQAQEKRNAGGH
jgi:hypothetical protein